MQSHCKPAIPFDVQVWKVEGRSVLEVQIPRSASRPHFCEDENGKWQAYLRREDRIHRASPVQVKVWQYEMRIDRSEFRYDQFIGKLFNAWRDGRQLRFQQVARMARLRYEDAEDLLCLLIVWNIIEWERGARGWSISWPMPPRWMSWRPVAPSNSDGKIIRDPRQYSEL